MSVFTLKLPEVNIVSASKMLFLISKEISETSVSKAWLVSLVDSTEFSISSSPELTSLILVEFPLPFDDPIAGNSRVAFGTSVPAL